MKIIVNTFSLLFFAVTTLLLPQNKTTLTLKLVPEELPFGLVKYVDAAEPNVAVVLSGGGARGLAHIGVLRALEENNIPIKNVIGTSMGSIIGGIYSAGYSIDEIDSIARNTPWDDFFSAGDLDRKEQFYDQKITNDKALFAIRLDGLKPILPTAFSTGQKVSNFLTLLALNAPIQTNTNYENLLYTFNAVCTDLVTGKRVVLNNGSLGLAMRASSSVMFLLSPVEMDSLQLIDGGLVANIPVDVAKELNSDFIIASDATSPLYSSEELKAPWRVADQLISIPMLQLNKQQLASADVVITPAESIYLNSDFNKADTLISDGYVRAYKNARHAAEKFKDKYFQNIEAEDTEYSNFKFISSDKEALKHFTELYDHEKVSGKQLLYMLGLLNRAGGYRSLSLEIDEAEETTIKIVTVKNPIVKNVNVIGCSALNDSIISQTKNLIIGKPFNSIKTLNAALDLIQHYRDEGLLLANIESINYDEETSTVIIKIREKVITKIVVSGNEKTNEDIILREFPINENDYLSIEKLKTGLANLRATDLFESVDVKVITINGMNELNIIVKEKISSLVRFGLRIDNEDFTQVSLDLRDENVFGTGTELGAILFYGSRKKSYILEHRSNRIFNTYLTYRLRGYFKLDDVNVYEDLPPTSENRIRREKTSEYRQLYLGGSFGVGSQFQKFGNIFIETKYERNEVKNKFDFPAARTYKEDISAVKFSLSIDSQNKFPYPTFGSRVNAFYETGLSLFNASTGFTKFYFDYIGYFSIGSNHTLAPKFVLGFADETLPLSQQFSLGGQQNFFGLREDEFRGRQVFKTSLEYQFVTPFKLFFDTFFRLRYDLGSIWSVREQIRFKDLRHGIGLTLSLDTPIGPADFSVGRSFVIERSLLDNVIKWGDTIFYFTIGYYY